MPNRIIKESVCRSDSIAQLTWFEEVLFYRLIVNCDDYGRFDGRAAIIKGSCFPLTDVTEKNILMALKKLSTAGLVTLYMVDSKPYLQLVTWEQHQVIRAKKSKYPKCENICMQMQADDCMLNQSNANVSVIQSNPNPNTNRNRNPNICAEQFDNSTAPEPADVEPLILNDGSEWVCTMDDYNEYVRLYPGVDVKQEFRRMRSWTKDNPAKRKTIRGIKRFVSGWLGRTQDSPASGRGSKADALKKSIDEMRDW